MPKNTDILEPGFSYHIYNRAIGSEKLFFEKKNYHYFLSKFELYLSAHLKIFAFCLMRNHFHFLAQVKDDSSPVKISEAFRRFGISYAQSINKQEGRMGSLFMKPIKRIRVSDDDYFRTLLVYIHTNPMLHGVRRDFENYYWSSYQAYLEVGLANDAIAQSGGIIAGQDQAFGLKILSEKERVIQTYFDDIENFKLLHRKKRDFRGLSGFLLE